MKLFKGAQLKLILAFFMFFSVNAFTAEAVIIDIGGVRHQCTPIGNGNAVQCYQTAYNGPYSKDEAMLICAGAWSEAPAKCGIEAYRGRFSKAESISLCQGATTDTGPIDCANLAYNGPFSKTESLSLCSNNGSERTATCALEAYQGPFSKEEAIKMCKNSRERLDKSLMSEKQYSKEELSVLIEEVNLKAFERKEYK